MATLGPSSAAASPLSPLPRSVPSTPVTPVTPSTGVSVASSAPTGTSTPDANSLNWQYPPAASATNSGNSTPQGTGAVPGPHSPVTIAPRTATTLPFPAAAPLASSPPPSGSTITSITPTKPPPGYHTTLGTPPDSPPSRPTPVPRVPLPQSLPNALPPPALPPKEPPVLIAPPRRQSMSNPPNLSLANAQQQQQQQQQPTQQQVHHPPPVPSLPSYIVEINQALATSATLSEVPPLSPVATTIGSDMAPAMSHPSKPPLHWNPQPPPPVSAPVSSSSSIPQRSNPPSAGPAPTTAPTQAADPVLTRIWDMCDHSAAFTDGVRMNLEGKVTEASGHTVVVPKARLVEAVNSISKSRKRVMLYFRLGLGLGPLVDVTDYTELLRGLTVLLVEYEAAVGAADKTRKRVTKSIMSRFSSSSSSSTSPKSIPSSSASSSDPFSVNPAFLLTGSYTHLKDLHLPCDISTYHVLQTLLDMVWSLYQFQLSRVNLDQFPGDDVKQHLLEALVRVDSRLQKIVGSIERDVKAVVARLEEHDRMRKSKG
ncbi:hypothetical protein BCR44DRAFT_44225, partial [Catenaria anguillulae PL171]